MKLKFKHKAIVIAVSALSTVFSINASAAIAQNELFLYVYDANSASTFVKSLTTDAPNFVNQTTSWTSSSANWNTFMSAAQGAAGYSAEGIFYQVLGYNSSTKTVWNTSNNILENMPNNADSGALFQDVVTPGSTFKLLDANTTNAEKVIVGTLIPAFTDTDLSDGDDSYAAYYESNSMPGDSWGGTQGYSVQAGLGQDLGFYKIENGTNPGVLLGLRSVTQYLGADNSPSLFNLDSNGVLTYTVATVAAVPEVDTSAMMISGIALMGFIARRRKLTK